MDIDFEIRFNGLLQATAEQNENGDSKEEVTAQLQQELHNAGLIQESLTPATLQTFSLAGMNTERVLFPSVFFLFYNSGINISVSLGP